MHQSSARSALIAIATVLLVVIALPPADAQAQKPPAPASAPSPQAEAPAPERAPPLSAKERLSEKWTDEQRVDNCKVPPAKRGPKPRPDACPTAPTASR